MESDHADETSANVLLDAHDPLSRSLIWAIILVILCIVSVVLYALAAGVINPPAPRTQAEAVRAQSKAAVEQNRRDGRAWAQYARSLYLGGDKHAGWDALEAARGLVKDKTVRYLNNVELDFLIRDGKNAEAVKRSDEFVKKDAAIRKQEIAKYAARGIKMPEDWGDSAITVQLFVLRATAQGNVKEWPGAISSLNQALRFDERAADVIAMRGWARLRAGDKKKAEKDFRMALRFLPDDESAKQGLAALRAR